MIATGTSNWQLRPSERVIKGNEALLGRKHALVAMTRIRNEALILPDTLDYLSTQVDAIVAYDDASTDDTVDILRKHPKVALIVANRSWEADVEARKRAEGRHRGLLLDMARTELPSVLLASGKREAARAALPPPDDLQFGTSESAWPASVRVALGDTAGVRQSLAVLTRQAGQRYVAKDLMATVKLALGDVPGALDLLEQAADERAFSLILVGVYPPYRALVREPRYQRLLARLGLPPEN